MSAKKECTLAELLDVLIERAPKLRAAGVTAVALNGLSATLAPLPAQIGELPASKPVPDSHIDPLKDASTFPGGRLPGFTRPKE